MKLVLGQIKKRAFLRRKTREAILLGSKTQIFSSI